jgi:hypothetical protein
VITDRRFGAVLVTEHGKQLTFDSIDCLGKHSARTHAVAKERWVVDAERPGTLIAYESAVISENSDMHPPMGRLVAHGR